MRIFVKRVESKDQSTRFKELFCIGQSDCIKKNSSSEEKKTRCEAKLTTPVIGMS